MLKTNDSPTRILIVDDEPTIRVLLRDFLSEDHQCSEAGSAEEALALLGEEKFNLVLSDIQMGGLSGLDMLPRLFELAPESVIVMISGMLTIESAIAAQRAGAFDYITKPFNFAQVGAAVRRALDHQALREANRQSEGRFKQIVEHATDIIYQTDVKGNFILVNPIAADVMKQPAESVIGLHYLELVRPDCRAAAERFYQNQFANKVTDTYYEFPVLTANGGEVWFGQNVQLLVDTNRVVGFQAVARDITRQRFYDVTTGLPNRVFFESRLDEMAFPARQSEHTQALILLSPDRFKRVVDTLGHAAADRLLRSIAERLTRCIAPSDLLARFGDDEFSILAANVSGPEYPKALAKRIHNALKQPIQLDKHEFYVTASIGIALPAQDEVDAQALMKNAGAALFRAKEQGGNNSQFYAAEMTAKALKRLSLESGLRRALDREEFIVHYQPQIEIATGRLTGMEALVRWQHPEIGLVSPAEFIPLAEELGIIIALDKWVLRTACAQNKEWQEAGAPPLRVSSNLSARLFQEPGLAETIAAVLKETRLGPQYLDLELTESSVMSNAEIAMETLRALKKTGVHISIDDFGTGYSSLNYLKKFRVDCLKIDQSFIREAPVLPDDAAIVMAIITLAHSLNLKVIAEGVETQAQLSFLRLLKCDAIQGYLISRPLPAREFQQKFLEPPYIINIKDGFYNTVKF
jgi:diguanylate cyclase (GGDEF)-like protein/PAS domain S-box-containing protein